MVNIKNGKIIFPLSILILCDLLVVDNKNDVTKMLWKTFILFEKMIVYY